MSNTQEGMACQDDQILAVTKVLKNLDTNEKEKGDKKIEDGNLRVDENHYFFIFTLSKVGYDFM